MKTNTAIECSEYLLLATSPVVQNPRLFKFHSHISLCLFLSSRVWFNTAVLKLCRAEVNCFSDTCFNEL
jgi:hypothetical protein